MKKVVLLILIVLYAEKLFSYECRASKDANLYGNAYPFKVSDRIGIIKENSAVYFDSIQLTTYTIAGEASYLNADYSYYLRITTESGNQGYISLLDISSMKNVSAIHELKNYIWEAKYEIDVLQSKDRDMVERFNPLYANYDEWRECTDWQEDKWYNVYSSPLLVLSDSIIYFSDRQGFRGFVGGHIDRIDDEKKEITWTCMESKSNDFSMEPVKSLFAPHFTKGLTYVFTYDLDGDYLTIFLDGEHFYDFVKADRKTREEIGRLISPRYGEVFDEKNITWPRHADGTCDYEEANGNATATSENQGTEESANAPATESAESVEESAIPKPAPAVGKTAAVTENLRLRTDNRTTAEVVATLAAGTRVKILAVGRGDTIDGIASNWVRVAVLGGARDRDGNAVAAGTEGWLFGGYLSEVESAESQSPSGETDAAKVPALPIVLVVAGVAVLAILLAAILLAAKKRKGGMKQK